LVKEPTDPTTNELARFHQKATQFAERIASRIRIDIARERPATAAPKEPRVPYLTGWTNTAPLVRARRDRQTFDVSSDS
jgi:hypothetical protein